MCSPPARSCRATSWVRDTSPASAWRSARCSDGSPAKRRLDMRASDTATIPLTLVQDGERVMRICNACRYCEGFCAVFPAIERRLVFAEADLVYLANLCHNCGAVSYTHLRAHETPEHLVCR